MSHVAFPYLIPVVTATAVGLGSGTTVPIEWASAVAIFTSGLVYWLSNELRGMKDDIRSIKEELKSRPCQKDKSNGCPME